MIGEARTHRPLATSAYLLVAALGAALLLLPDPAAGSPGARPLGMLLMIKAASLLIVILVSLVVASLARWAAKGSYRVYYATLCVCVGLALAGLGVLAVRSVLAERRAKEHLAFLNETKRLTRGLSAEIQDRARQERCDFAPVLEAVELLAAHLDRAPPRYRALSRIFATHLSNAVMTSRELCRASGEWVNAGYASFDATTDQEEFNRRIAIAEQYKKAVTAWASFAVESREKLEEEFNAIDDPELQEAVRVAFGRVYSKSVAEFEFVSRLSGHAQSAATAAVEMLTLARDRIGRWTIDDDGAIEFQDAEDSEAYAKASETLDEQLGLMAQVQQEFASKKVKPRG